jgi:hypothetical protein
MRVLLLLIPLLAGCAHPQPQPDPASFRSPGMERCLQYWTANFSGYPTNHFYVCATEMDQGELVRALVYWPEGGRLVDYAEMPAGAEAQAWRLRPKVDREAILTDETISRGNDVVPHSVWMDAVRRCITRGKQYTVALDEALAVFPKIEPSSQAQPGLPEPGGPAAGR